MGVIGKVVGEAAVHLQAGGITKPGDVLKMADGPFQPARCASNVGQVVTCDGAGRRFGGDFRGALLGGQHVDWDGG